MVLSSFHSFKAHFPDLWWLQADSSSKAVQERALMDFFKLSLFQSSFSGSLVVTGGFLVKSCAGASFDGFFFKLSLFQSPFSGSLVVSGGFLVKRCA